MTDRSRDPRAGIVGELAASTFIDLYDHSLEGMLLTRTDGAVVAANGAACAILAGTEAELIAAGRSGLLDLTDDRWAAAIAERAETGRVRAHGRMRRLDGTTIECEISSTVYRTVDGVKACVVFRDVTTEVGLLAALVASEARWRATVDNAPIGIALIGLDGRILSANAVVCNITGFDEEAILARTTAEVTHPDDRDTELDGALLRGELERYEVERRVLRADGTYVPIRLSVSLVRDEAGAPTHFVSQVQDVSARRAQVEAVLASERRAQHLADELGTLLGSVAEGIWGVDLQGRITFVNPAATRALGWAAEELVGRNAHVLLHHSHADGSPHPAAACPVGDVLAAGSWCEVEDDVLWRKDGTAVPVSYSARPLVRDGEIRGAVVTFSDTTERRLAAIELFEAGERLKEMASTDALTGLPNRALLSDRIDQALALAGREGWEVAVLFVDLDRFKHVNDSLGHHAGDELLAEVGRRIQAALRHSDTVARLGGDEFAILLGGRTSADEAAVSAERVLGCFDAAFVVGGVEMFASASVGVALWPQDCNTKVELLQHADLAMYRAKAAGGATFELFQPMMTLAVRQQLQVGNDLRRAVDADEFFVRYHPLVHLVTGEVVGVEALARWQHPTRGEVGPAAFVPLAEEMGLIVPIGASILRQGCARAARFRAAFPDRAPIRVSVNVSPKQLAHPRFVDAALATVEASGTAPQEIELEITEGILIAEGGPAVSAVRTLRRAGFTIAIDDFGTGYSSLAYLQRFPVDRLKLDRSFIAGLDAGGDALVAAAIDLGHALGIEVVAEGVETASQARKLTDFGCTLGQGYLWTMPLVDDELDHWLTAHARRPHPGTDEVASG